MLNTTLLRTLTDNPHIQIHHYNHPLPYPSWQNDQLDQLFDLTFVGVCSMSTSLVAIGIMFFILTEKESEMKNLILLSGMNMVI